MGDYRKLLAYQKAFELAMRIFEITKRFPPEEKYSLTDQFRRASRSVCANFAEACRRKAYRRHFLSKLYDSLTENAETEVWIKFSVRCGYISQDEHDELFSDNDEVARLICYMIDNPDKFR